MFIDEETALSLERLAWFEEMNDVDLLFCLATSLLREMSEENEGGVRALFTAARGNRICELDATLLHKSEAAKQIIDICWDDAEIYFIDGRARQAVTQVIYTPPVYVKGRVTQSARFKTMSGRILATRNPQPVRILRVE